LRTSSLPEPIVLDDSDGKIQLATTFNDPNLKDVTAKALLTDGQKINPLSEPIEASIGLGEVTS
jgi:fumarylacetoacetate (FAA) hydrolase family protein